MPVMDGRNSVMMDNTKDDSYRLPDVEVNCLNLQLSLLPGEGKRMISKITDGLIGITNFRLFLLTRKYETIYKIPLPAIEYCVYDTQKIESKVTAALEIYCKDASTVRCLFPSVDLCIEWQRRVTSAIQLPTVWNQYYCFFFQYWTIKEICESPLSAYNCDEFDKKRNFEKATSFEKDFEYEIIRMKFDMNTWRLSRANKEFTLCPTYPQLLLVPISASDENLIAVSNFRSSRRIPVIVWRHIDTGAVIARCSQPEVGWLGWRNTADENLLKAISDACAFNKGERNNTVDSSIMVPNIDSVESDDVAVKLQKPDVKKVLIVDARSYASAVTNRARGGGCECTEYYTSTDIEFMSLGNIHVVRKSFQSLRAAFSPSTEPQNFYSAVQSSQWLNHISALLSSANRVVRAIKDEARPVLVHCSDGWDRTPQIVATSCLLLDPFYRTMEGFRILVEREWLNFGHKFADRQGQGLNDETNERCPVFLQWLDCIHQIYRQYECQFEFNLGFLVKLAQHSVSCLFGTFLCNSVRDRITNDIYNQTFSVWPSISQPIYKNPLYNPSSMKFVLLVNSNINRLQLWKDVYTCSFRVCFNGEISLTDNTNVVQLIRDDIETDSNKNSISSRRSSEASIDRTSEINIHNGTIDSDISITGTDDNINDNLISGTTDLYNQNQSDNILIKNKTMDPSSSSSSPFFEAFLKQSSNDPKPGTILKRRSNMQSTLNDQTKAVSNSISTDKCISSIENEIMFKTTELQDLFSHDDVSSGIENQQWYGNIESSTDTLVPINSHNKQYDDVVDYECDTGISQKRNEFKSIDHNESNLPVKQNPELNHIQINNIPKVHGRQLKSITGNNCDGTSDDICEFLTIAISSNGDCGFVDGRTNRQLYVNSTSLHQRKPSISKDPTPEQVDTLRLPYLVNPSASPAIVRLLSLTSPGIQNERSISYTPIPCWDGLSHALSESSLRLHQLYLEFKVREAQLQKELQETRLALMKKSCKHCNNKMDSCSATVNHSNGDDCISMTDNTENVSVSSWETVDTTEDQNAQYLNNGSVLWVPDHAVTHCNKCGVLFWIGRRKHHCRSCGQIFCADCSEFSAPVPHERLYEPVRLCGSCFETVTNKIKDGNTNNVVESIDKNQSLAENQTKKSVHFSQTCNYNIQSTSNLSIGLCRDICKNDEKELLSNNMGN